MIKHIFINKYFASACSTNEWKISFCFCQLGQTCKAAFQNKRYFHWCLSWLWKACTYNKQHSWNDSFTRNFAYSPSSSLTHSIRKSSKHYLEFNHCSKLNRSSAPIRSTHITQLNDYLSIIYLLHNACLCTVKVYNNINWWQKKKKYCGYIVGTSVRTNDLSSVINNRGATIGRYNCFYWNISPLV